MVILEDTPFITLSPGKADAILAQLGDNPEKLLDPGHASGTEDNPVIIDGEEDEHPRSCITLKRIRSAVNKEAPPSKGHCTSPFQQDPSGKKLRRPRQLVALERKLRLRLPKGSFKFTPELAGVLPPGIPASFGPSCLSGRARKPPSLPFGGRIAREGEDEPQPLVFPTPHILFGEQGEDEPHRSPSTSIPSVSWASRPSEGHPHPPVARPSLPWISEQGEDEPHYSLSIPIPTGDRGTGESAEKPHPPVTQTPPVPFSGLGADEPHRPYFLPVQPASASQQSCSTKGHRKPVPGKRRRTRRAGRKYQVRKLLKGYYQASVHLNTQTLFKWNCNNNLTLETDPITQPVNRGLRIIKDRRYTGTPIRIVDPHIPNGF